MAPNRATPSWSRILQLISNCRRLYALLGPDQRRFWLLVIGMVAAAFATAGGIASVIPLMQTLAAQTEDGSSQPFLLGVLSNDPRSRFSQALVAFFGLLSLSSICQALLQKQIILFGQRMIAALSKRAFASYLARDLVFHIGRDPIDLTKSLLSEVSSLVAGGIAPMMNLLSASATLLIVSALLMAVSPVATSAILVTGLAAFLLSSRSIRRSAHHASAERLKFNHLRARLAQEAFRSIREVKIYDAEPRYIGNFSEAMHEFCRYEGLLSWMRSRPRYTVEVAALGVLVVSVLIAVNLMGMAPEDVVASVGIFALAALRLIPQGNAAVAAVTTLHSVGPFLERLEEHVHPFQAPEHGPQGGDCQVAQENKVCLSAVSFRYPGAQYNALEDVNLEFRPGQSVALVGTNGSGKTTLADVLMGLLQPTTGTVTRAFLPFSSIHESAPHAHIGYVTQRVSLFNATLRENIALGVPPAKIDDKAVLRALAAVNLETAFLDGDSPQLNLMQELGADGRGVSGGQLQRIGIARALYRNPSLLVLDEATSAVDNETERLLIQNIRSRFGGLIIVHIAHRLSAIRSCDRVIVLEKGRLVGDGAYDALVDKFPLLRELT